MYISNNGYPGIEVDVVCEQAVAIGRSDIKMSETVKKPWLNSTGDIFHRYESLHAANVADL